MEISTVDINIQLGGNKILNNLSMHVNDREFVGIIGPNGSGKSTLLKSIYRTLRPESGAIYLDSKNIVDISLKDSAKKMAVVSQHNEMSFDFSVLEMVLMGRAPHKKFMERDNVEDFEIALDSLDKVGMGDFIERSFNSLSGGEKQRVILARALTQETPCLILDEPTNHLDIKYQLQFMSIAKSLNITIISAIHDLNIASLYCDVLYALKDGKMIHYGSPKEVLTSEIIKELYDVDSEIHYSEDGKINVVYKPI